MITSTHLFEVLGQIRMTLHVGWIGFESKHAKIAIVSGRSELPLKDGSCYMRIWVRLGFIQKASMDTNIGTNIKENMIAPIAKLAFSYFVSIFDDFAARFWDVELKKKGFK
jgi:hypothetical protein